MDDVKNTVEVAPFVLKTYKMVDDPSTDSFITWGAANNSFVVIDMFKFSNTLLPAYFKHNNFSSFVRQLNTYGFKKVDQDTWEFANRWFLRGQVAMLKNIVRKQYKRINTCYYTSQLKQENHEGEKSVEVVVRRLKRDQKVLEEELEGIEKRLKVTQRQPQEVIDYLLKVMEEPGLPSGLMVQKKSHVRILVPVEAETFVGASVESEAAVAEAMSYLADYSHVLQEWRGPGEASNHSDYPFSLLGEPQLPAAGDAPQDPPAH